MKTPPLRVPAKWPAGLKSVRAWYEGRRREGPRFKSKVRMAVNIWYPGVAAMAARRSRSSAGRLEFDGEGEVRPGKTRGRPRLYLTMSMSMPLTRC